MSEVLPNVFPNFQSKQRYSSNGYFTNHTCDKSNIKILISIRYDAIPWKSILRNRLPSSLLIPLIS